MNISIVIYSATGKTQAAAQLIGQGIAGEGCQYKIMSVEDIDRDYLEASQAVIFGTPTYYANICWQMKQWMDQGFGGVNLAGKLGAVFATANTLGGGAENANLTLINHILVKGMLVYSGGCACGQPYTHIGVTCINQVPMENPEQPQMSQKNRLITFGGRIAAKAKELFER